MSRRVRKQDPILIAPEIYDQIMAWCQSLTEVVFVLGGTDRMVTAAIRLVNYSRAPRNYFEYATADYREARQRIKEMGLEPICFGHSHPSKWHLKKLSKLDIEGVPKGILQMIVFPESPFLKVWEMSAREIRAVRVCPIGGPI